MTICLQGAEAEAQEERTSAWFENACTRAIPADRLSIPTFPEYASDCTAPMERPVLQCLNRTIRSQAQDGLN